MVCYDINFASKNIHVCILFIGNSIAYRDASSRFGSGSGSVFLDQLSCSGTESVLLDCRARPLGLAECNTDDVAGVQCKGSNLFLLMLSMIIFKSEAALMR